ncbi:MAG: hypothetical protein GXO47_02995 [Chlorobi bacterium]|nr:hypothetical protein [Chlorobiota bacterium]
MKNIYKILSGFFLIAGLFYMSSCEERVELDYTVYSPDAPAKFTYAEKTFYPMKTVLASDTPVFSVEGLYTLKIDSVYAASIDDYDLTNFKIDDETGVITYNNAGGTINPGQYALDISIHTINHIVNMEKAYSFTVLDVPVSITASETEVYTGALQQGVISTISYTDESPEQNLIVDSYSIYPYVVGYSINENGEILKSTSAIPNTTDSLSITVNTNLGSKTFKNVVVVHVGPPPSILYTKTSDSDTLKNVIMAPTSVYSTVQPVLEGMNSDGGWELVLADTVPQEVIDALTIDNNGIITYNGSGNVPDGVYTVSVKVTNSTGVSFEFKDLFTLTIQTKWSQVFYGGDEFGDGTITYSKDPTSVYMFGDGGGYAKGYHADGDIFYSMVTAQVDITSDWNGNKLLISFDELNGWGANQEPVYAEFERTLEYSYDQANWTTIMSPDDTDWPMTGAGSYVSVKDQDAGSIDTSNSALYIRWTYNNSASDTKSKSVWKLDNFLFKYTVDYDIIEE